MKKITLEQAQELTGDDQAILRGYLTQEVIDYAYKIIEEKAQKNIYDSKNGCGNPHQYWMDNFESYREMSEAFPEGGRNTRKYSRCCELVDKLTLILYQDLSFEEAKDTI